MTQERNYSSFIMRFYATVILERLNNLRNDKTNIISHIYTFTRYSVRFHIYLLHTPLRDSSHL